MTPEHNAANELYHAASMLEVLVKQINFGPDTKTKLIDKINACRKAAAALGFKDQYV